MEDQSPKSGLSDEVWSAKATYKNREALFEIPYGQLSNSLRPPKQLKPLYLDASIPSGIGRKVAISFGEIVCPFETV
jgi:hypothetical protein